MQIPLLSPTDGSPQPGALHDMDASPDVPSIVAKLRGGSESSRKLAVFQLQSLLQDSTFARAFVEARGLSEVKDLILHEHGNTLAYALGSLTRLLELNLGWEAIGADVTSRAVGLVVDRPVINVLRNALYLLVLVVSRPGLSSRAADPLSPTTAHFFESTSMRPIYKAYDTLLGGLTDKLSSADHVLRGNALRLINALMRETVMQGGEEDFLNLVRRLQELDITACVEVVMRGDAIQDLAGPLLEFERLTMLIQKRWKEARVNIENPKHARALKMLHTSSFPPSYSRPDSSNDKDKGTDGRDSPEMWRRLGFETEAPEEAFEETGLLGLMDLTEYVRRNPNTYQKAMLEQSVWPPEYRCPIARASLSATMMLFEYFDVENVDPDALPSDAEGLDADLIIQPLSLRWILLHTVVVNAFWRLWKAARATQSEFEKIEDLLVVFIQKVIGGADRKTTTEEVEHQFGQIPLETVRQWQLEDLDQLYNNAWGADLRRVREQLHTEAVQFMQEQRIRCLLQGAWFPVISTTNSHDRSPSSNGPPRPSISSWRFVQLAPNRRHLHCALHPKKIHPAPSLTDMPSRIDINNITSVVSNVTAADLPEELQAEQATKIAAGHAHAHGASTITKITINGPSRNASSNEEAVLLALYTTDSVTASEWLDGLLMLLDQQPITADTSRLIGVIEEWGLKVRMLNLRWEDLDYDAVISAVDGTAGAGAGAGAVAVAGFGYGRTGKVYSREGLDADYWYDMGEV